MSADQLLSSDFRGPAQDYKRDAARKHKWALGAVGGPDESLAPGRAAGSVRPCKPSETSFSNDRRWEKAAAAYSNKKSLRQRDQLDGPAHTLSDASSSHSNSSAEGYDEKATSVVSPDAGITYSFDAPHGPSQGSQILNVALAKAVERFEEKETLRLVRKEYDVLDTEGESVAVSANAKEARRARKKMPAPPSTAAAASTVDAEEDYEFV